VNPLEKLWERVFGNFDSDDGRGTGGFRKKSSKRGSSKEISIKRELFKEIRELIFRKT